LVGALFGGFFAALKFVVLWRPLSRGKKLRKTSAVMTRYGAGYGINIVALFIVYLCRNVNFFGYSLLFSFEYALIGTALVLVLAGKLYPFAKFLPDSNPEQDSEQISEQSSEEV